MDQLTLYNQILGLTSPWKTVSVDLKQELSEVIVNVTHDRNITFCCPKCGNSAPIYDQRARQWRHLDTCQYKTIIKAKVPRIACPEHGVLTVQIPWSEGSSHYSKLFENEVVKWAKEISILAVTRRFRISWSSVDRIIHRALQRGLEKSWEYDCTHLSVDETCIKKGREFITVLSNHHGQVISLEDGRSGDSLINCLQKIPIQCLLKTRTISMDMSSAYIGATNKFFGNKAKKIISIDHFHISKILTSALSDVRRSGATGSAFIKQIAFT